MAMLVRPIQTRCKSFGNFIDDHMLHLLFRGLNRIWPKPHRFPNLRIQIRKILQKRWKIRPLLSLHPHQPANNPLDGHCLRAEKEDLGLNNCHRLLHTCYLPECDTPKGQPELSTKQEEIYKDTAEDYVDNAALLPKFLFLWGNSDNWQGLNLAWRENNSDMRNNICLCLCGSIGFLRVWIWC